MLKMVHCADIHAGRPAPADLDREKASLRRFEIENSLKKIVKVAREEKAHMFFVAGDMLEHVYTGQAWVREAASLFSSIPDTRVFIAPGNHDPVVKDSLYRSTKWPDNVRIFGSSLEQVLLPDLGAAVYGFGWSSFNHQERILKNRTAAYAHLLNVLIVHGQLVTGDSGGALFEYLPIPHEDILGFGAHYAALGHVHAPGVFGIGGTTVVYPGCPEPLDFGDGGDRGAFFVVAEKGAGDNWSLNTEFLPLACRQMRAQSVDVTGADTVEQIRNKIMNLGDAGARKNDLWSVTLTGVLPPDLEVNVRGLERDVRDSFFFLRLVPRYVPGYDLLHLCERRDTLEARFVERLRALIENSKDPDEVAKAELAMYYGLDALRQGRVFLRRDLL